MADVRKLLPFILRWEGGFVNDPLDKGGATNMGVTLRTWKACGYDKDGDGDIDVDDLKAISREDVLQNVLIPHYWNRWRADEIKSQSLANILVDWVYASGVHGIKWPQRILHVQDDGVVGPKTIAALNAHPDPESLFYQIQASRLAFCDSIVKSNPTQKRFLLGWKNRINAIKWEG